MTSGDGTKRNSYQRRTLEMEEIGGKITESAQYFSVVLV